MTYYPYKYYELANLVDKKLNMWYATQYSKAIIKIAFSQNTYIYRLRIFPVSL